MRHLHLLGGSQPHHKVLGDLAEKYGLSSPSLGFTKHWWLLVSSREIAKECYTTNHKVFASRPKWKAVEIMGYNYAMFGVAPYGNEDSRARDLRRMVRGAQEKRKSRGSNTKVIRTSWMCCFRFSKLDASAEDFPGSKNMQLIKINDITDLRSKEYISLYGRFMFLSFIMVFCTTRKKPFSDIYVEVASRRHVSDTLATPTLMMSQTMSQNYLQKRTKDSTMYGFRGGTAGVMKGKYVKLTDEFVYPYRSDICRNDKKSDGRCTFHWKVLSISSIEVRQQKQNNQQKWVKAPESEQQDAISRNRPVAIDQQQQVSRRHLKSVTKLLQNLSLN
ncbi:cytochrome P450-like protein [Artemisia annua]|uniref:Cytochrome P450-like protein n=1 Tax=Artemisia annua TaxID=35608 RepID=A0A2U1M9N9_ARTAN|nr:cytochrome P450-like protein [Artemisia annua]